MGDVLTGCPPETRRGLPRWLAALAVTLVAVGAVAWMAIGRWPSGSGSPPTAPAAVPPAAATSPAPPAVVPAFTCAGQPIPAAPRPTLPPGSVTAMALTGAVPGGALDRRGRTATAGPWASVVRRSDGALGRHGAVVIFPVTETPLGRPVRVGGAPGRVTTGTVIWSIAGARARVRGDLGEPALLRIAAATRVAAGRPTVRPPAGYRVARVGPYRSPRAREIRYGGAELGPNGGLGGLVYTGVAAGIDFEDRLYATFAHGCGTVHGSPAVVSTVGGGNGAIAWQPAPNMVAYLGYSGSDLSGSVLGALYRLAGQTRFLDERGWRAAKPQVVDQPDIFG